MSTAIVDPDLREIADGGQIDLAIKLQRKRNERAERSERLLDPRIRQIGANVDEWERQIVEKEQVCRTEMETAENDRRALEEFDRVAEQIENERRQSLRDIERDARQFSLAHLHKEARREFILSDPKRDLSIDTCHLGPSSAQVFAGEFVEDKRAKQNELVRGLTDQNAEKKLIMQRNAAIERAYAELAELDFETRLELDVSQENDRRNERKRLDSQNGKLLNGDIGTSYDFKGISMENKQTVVDEQAMQVEEKRIRIQAENEQASREAQEAEARRLEAVRIYDEEQLKRRRAAEELVAENRKLAESQRNGKKRSEEIYSPAIDEAFFAQFAKSACH
ncbi:hypothetical protein FOL47_006735 [Perkinsus chesapeaki]|uniref:RIB43A-like with coiled-coils protein 2 n=1 Tax=Perkinsus chesapeaki TaxID=330153 RepID=A0A7J6LQ91_PERCH|nr:hypothetical protein FOL47_006735 [Perkinsus chesapeaki]